jgi:protein-S-isoprenylcysteine O-methyltransferase Ste14
MVFPNFFFIGFAVLAIVSIHFFILKEEKFMGKIYGADYEKYLQKVRRYF